MLCAPGLFRLQRASLQSGGRAQRNDVFSTPDRECSIGKASGGPPAGTRRRRSRMPSRRTPLRAGEKTGSGLPHCILAMRAFRSSTHWPCAPGRVGCRDVVVPSRALALSARCLRCRVSLRAIGMIATGDHGPLPGLHPAKRLQAAPLPLADGGRHALSG